VVSDISSKGVWDSLSALPQGWVWTHVDEISSLIRGVSYNKSEALKTSKEGFLPILRATNINKQLNFDDLVYVPNSCISSEQMIRKFDVIFAMSSGSKDLVGKSAQATSDFYGGFGTFCGLIRPVKGLNEHYFGNFFQSPEYRKTISTLSSGIGINNLRRGDIESMALPLPPLAEQHRIVTKIEELLTQLDVGVASLKKVEVHLNRYRRAVLKAAFEGRLTQEWREEHKGEIESAVVFIKRLQEKKIKTSRQESTAQPEISSLPLVPDSWSYATADQISQKITDGEHIMPERGEIGIPYVSARNVQNGYLNLDSVDHVTNEVYSFISKRLVVESGDVLLSCSGSVGRTCVVPENFKCTLNRSVAIIKPIAKMGKYLSYALRSSFLQRQIDEKKTQTAQANIFQGKIRTLTFPIASQSEQDEIVIEIERHFSQIDHLEHTITTSLRQADTLRQSILKQAFEGKLVPQDPNDEPASILLERIKAEKARHAAEVKKGKTLQHQSPKRKIKHAN
jgi:type I restriction enzyme S subunit